jgi:hypothetical protein
MASKEVHPHQLVPDHHADSRLGLLDQLGGELLPNSGFESEDPEPDFDERS